MANWLVSFAHGSERAKLYLVVTSGADGKSMTMSEAHEFVVQPENKSHQSASKCSVTISQAGRYHSTRFH